ncbi:MAG: tRNA modification GTPase [Pirellulaceae bacterium]|nr:tRNA modification GTPase [Pirellulaceae bacterium]
MAYDVDDTIAAIASASGGSARGILRLSGPETIACLRACFHPTNDQPLPSQQATRVTGHLNAGEPIGDLDCQVYVWPTQRSYTRQPAAEVHTIGSPPILELLLQTLCKHGARLAEPGEFTLRAFLAGRLDLPQAEAVLGVIDATNQQQLDVSLTQLAGGLSSKLNQLRDGLLNLCADLEAGLDFVDEDIEFVSATESTRQLTTIEQAIASVVDQMQRRGESYFTPRIVLRGRPNAGKSTLWNTLTAQQTAITSNIPGTTRDYLESAVKLGGIACTLIDTAGVDDQPLDQIDAAAREMTAQRHEQAHVNVLCIDSSTTFQQWDASQLACEQSVDLAVLTKSDSIANFWQSEHEQFGFEVTPGAQQTTLTHFESGRVIELIHISCHQTRGVNELLERMNRALGGKLNDESSVVTATSTRCRESLRRALEDVGRARQLASGQAGDELVAAEIRNALNELGKVVGAVYTEDVLDRIFSRFCIGK